MRQHIRGSMVGRFGVIYLVIILEGMVSMDGLCGIRLTQHIMLKNISKLGGNMYQKTQMDHLRDKELEEGLFVFFQRTRFSCVDS